ncbi:MAG: response regulator [Candidatus Saccharibacteria bacterium]|nr:response regulator [Pseudorhodobacter sp.]
MTSETLLKDRRILVVEDEMMIAMMLQDILEDAGCTVICARHLEQALDLARDQALDGAVLDENLHGKQSYPVADMLAGRGIPFIFATGYSQSNLEKLYPGRRILIKPYWAAEVIEALSAVISTSDDVR